MEPETRKLTPVEYGRILKQIEIDTHMDILVCLVFVPQKWGLGSNPGALAEGQEVSSEWEVKRWRCEHVFTSSESQRCYCCCSCSDRCLGMQTLPSPSLLCCRAPVATLRSLCHPDPLGSASRCPLTAASSCAGLPSPSLLRGGSSSSPRVAKHISLSLRDFHQGAQREMCSPHPSSAA